MLLSPVHLIDVSLENPDKEKISPSFPWASKTFPQDSDQLCNPLWLLKHIGKSIPKSLELEFD